MYVNVNEAQVILFTLFCLMPLIFIFVCMFWRVLVINDQENDTRRYPRYGQSPDMRTKGKSRIKAEEEDNQT